MRNALRQLTLGTVRNTAGRNSQGRITAFHRGGGSKRLQRKIDLKRTNSSMGIVERIEYDPNRSSRIALVRWMEGVQHKKKPNKVEQDLGHIPPSQTKSATSATVDSIFSCSSLKPIALDRRQISATFCTPANEVVVGLPGLLPLKTQLSGASKITTPKDVFISAFSKANGENAPAHIPFPRIAVAGAKPNFFVPQLREEIKQENETVSVALAEVRKWMPQSIVWQHRNKPKAALSWKSLVRQESLGLAGVAQHNLSKHKDKAKTDHGSGNLPAKPDAHGHKDGESGVERTPVSYIIASNHLEPGKMVMNCDWSKSSSTGQASAARHSSVDRYEILDFNSQIGNCVPLTDIRIGTWVHNIECKPGQGAKLARSAGTSAKVIKEPGRLCHLRLPSGVVKLVDSRCRATIGTVSNPTHNARKLRKAGHSRWLGIRPTVRGVAMNPVDHPHGGGEGRTSGGRPSVSPWGKPTKAGYKTAGRRRRHSR